MGTDFIRNLSVQLFNILTLLAFTQSVDFIPLIKNLMSEPMLDTLCETFVMSHMFILLKWISPAMYAGAQLNKTKVMFI